MVGPGKRDVQKKTVTSKAGVAPQSSVRRSARLTPTKGVSSFRICNEENQSNDMITPYLDARHEIRSKRLFAQSNEMPTMLETPPLCSQDDNGGEDQTNEEITSEENMGSSSHAKRGPTRCLEDVKRCRQDQTPGNITVDQSFGRLVGENSQLIISKAGATIREYSKFDGSTWKYQTEEIKSDILSKCMENTTHDESTASIEK